MNRSQKAPDLTYRPSMPLLFHRQILPQIVGVVVRMFFPVIQLAVQAPPPPVKLTLALMQIPP